MGNIISLSGLAGSGKSTVAKILVNDYNFIEIAFADPIKRAVMNWWDFTEDQLWGSSDLRNLPDERYPIDNGFLIPRSTLTTIGSDIARVLDKDVWVRYGIKTAKRLLEEPYSLNYKRTVGIFNEKRKIPIAGVIISDVRFTNEFIRIKSEEGIIIRVKNDRAGLSGKAAVHVSETEHQAWPDENFNVLIYNNGTLEELDVKVREMVESFVGESVLLKKQLGLFE